MGHQEKPVRPSNEWVLNGIDVIVLGQLSPWLRAACGGVGMEVNGLKTKCRAVCWTLSGGHIAYSKSYDGVRNDDRQSTRLRRF